MMNTEELAKKLKNLGIPTNIYSISGGLPNEKLCLEGRDGKWYIYYVERGRRTSEVEYNTEAEACDVFLNEMKGEV